MRENATEVIVGGAVLAAAAIFAVYLAGAAGVRQPPSEYNLSAKFRSVEGVSVGTDVRLAGVKVGTISDLRLNPETFRAEVVMTIREGLEMPDDSSVSISSEGLLGGNFVELIPGGSPFNLESGDEIEDTQSAVSLVSLLLKFVSGGRGQ